MSHVFSAKTPLNGAFSFPEPEMSHDTHLIESEISSESVFKGVLLDVRKDEVRLPNGKQTVREYIVHPGAVVVLAFLDNGNLLFERQFRYPLRRVFLELPAGKIDPGEAILDTARRELLEETGHVARLGVRWGHASLHRLFGRADRDFRRARTASHRGKSARPQRVSRSD